MTTIAQPLRLHGTALACSRAGRLIFAGLDLSVTGGQALVLTGRNGAGKSTLLMLIAGLIGPTSGSLTLDGGRPDTPLAEEAHYLGHRDAIKPSLTAREALSFWSAMLGGGGIDPADALGDVGLGHAIDLPCAYLSAGQRRRLAMARLLVARRPLWLLDEPTAALDAASQARFAVQVDAHCANGGIAVIATHMDLGLSAPVVPLVMGAGA